MKRGRLGGKDILRDVNALRPFMNLPAGGGGADTYKVSVSADDTTPNFLEAKVTSADGSVTIATLNGGNDEDLDLSVAAYVASEIATHEGDPNAHHNQSHVLATTTGLGADHTVSGLAPGQVLRASGAATAAFAAIQGTDLPSGATLSVSSVNSGTSHAITTSSNPGATAAILATNASGYLQLVQLGLGITPTAQLHASSAADAKMVLLEPSGVSAQMAVSIENLPLSTDVSTGKVLQIKVAGESFGRMMVFSDGKVGWGGGAATRDVYLSRSAANILKISSDGASGIGNLQFNEAAWVGLSSTTARLMFDISTLVRVKAGDISVDNTRYLRFYRTGDTASGAGISLDATDLWALQQDTVGATIAVAQRLTDLNYFRVEFREDPAQTNRGQLDLGIGAQGTKLTIGGEIEVHGQGGSGGETHIYIGSAADSAFSSVGLTIHQGTVWDTIFTLQNNVVAHGMTDLTDSNTFFDIKMYQSANGGAALRGWNDVTSAIVLQAFGTTDTAARTTGAGGYIELRAYKKSLATADAPGADANLVVIASALNARAIFDQEGELHLDGSVFEGVWDEYDDISLLTGLRASLLPPDHELRRRFGEFIHVARPVLEATRVVTYNDGPGGDGSTFIAMKKLAMLTIDAVRQVAQRLEHVERQLLTGGHE